MLNQSAHVLDRDKDASDPEFGHYYADPENPTGTGVWLTDQDYEDMKQPAQITVTVVPGDTLNIKES